MNKNDKYTPDSEKRFTLRINKEIFEKVKASAEKNRRSVAKEIEYILFQKFENTKLSESKN